MFCEKIAEYKYVILRLLLFLFLIFFAFTICVGILFLPYHFYYIAITEGIESEYINLEKSPRNYLTPVENNIDIVDLDLSGGKESLWKVFHFSDFSVPLPVHHPEISIVPKINIVGDSQVLGWDLADTNKSEIFSFLYRSNEPFIFRIDKYKLFSFPIVRKKILEKSINDIWRDIFTKDINLPDIKKYDYLTYFKQIYEIPYLDLAYNLFLLNMRLHIFDKDMTKSFSYLPKKNIGILTQKSLDERYLVQRILLLNNGIVYNMKISSRKWDTVSKRSKEWFFNILDYRGSNLDSSQKIYAEYKFLPYHKKITQEGMSYLFASWSHDTENSEFLREMIHFLERGKFNKMQLKSIYDYCYSRYGTNFSRFGDLKQESAERKLQRKITEELEEEISVEKNNNSPVQEGEFKSDREKIDYFLQQAKDSGENIDELDSRLER